jgi:hypothetical protein
MPPINVAILPRASPQRHGLPLCRCSPTDLSMSPPGLVSSLCRETVVPHLNPPCLLSPSFKGSTPAASVLYSGRVSRSTGGRTDRPPDGRYMVRDKGGESSDMPATVTLMPPKKCSRSLFVPADAPAGQQGRQPQFGGRHRRQVTGQGLSGAGILS